MPCVGAPEGRTRGIARPSTLPRATAPAAKWLHYLGWWQPECEARRAAVTISKVSYLPTGNLRSRPYKGLYRASIVSAKL